MPISQQIVWPPAIYQELFQASGQGSEQIFLFPHLPQELPLWWEDQDKNLSSIANYHILKGCHPWRCALESKLSWEEEWATQESQNTISCYKTFSWCEIHLEPCVMWHPARASHWLWCFFVCFCWSVADLQCRINLRYTAKWLSYTYIHILFQFPFSL